MIYIIDGQEVTAQQAQAMADQLGLPLKTYLDSVGATIKEGSEKDFLAGVAEEDAAVTPVYPEASELESELENISLELAKKAKTRRTARPSGTERQLSQKRRRIERELENYYNSQAMDIKVPETIINKGNTDVKEFLQKNFNWLRVEESGFNNVTAYLPDGPIEIDLQTLTNRDETLKEISKIYEADKVLTSDEKLGMTATRAVDQISVTRDTKTANQLLSGTGYEIVQNSKITTTPISGGYGMASNVQNVDYSYTLLKDGVEVVPSSSLLEVDKYLETNLNKKDLQEVNKNAYEATSIALKEKRKKLEEEAKVIEADKSIDKKYFEDNFSEDLILSLGLEKDSEEAVQINRYFREKKGRRYAKERQAARTSRLEDLTPEEEYVQSLTNLSDLPANIQELIANKFGTGEQGLKKFKEVVNEGLINFRYDELMTRATTIGERLMEKSGNQELLRMSQLYLMQDKKIFDENTKKKVDLTIDIYQNQLNKILAEEGVRITESGPEGTKFSLTLVDGAPVFNLENDRDLTPEESKQFDIASNKMFKLQEDFANLQYDFNGTLQNIKTDIDEFYAGSGISEELYNDAIKEYGLPQLVAKDVNDAFASLLLTVPTLLNSDWAINQQRILNDKNKYYETMTTWDGGDFGTYFFRTLGQQSANIALAIGTGGVGGAVGRGLGWGAKFTNSMTANAIGLQFGLSSGTQTFRDLTVQQDIVKLARSQGIRAKQALDSGSIDQDTYFRVMNDINNTITLNELTPEQITGAAFANGIIEGTFTRFLGTAPNTIALLKDFRVPTNVTTIANNIGKSGGEKIFNMAGGTLGRRLGMEIAEEELIYLGQSFVTEFGILDRDLKLDQFDDTFFATLITAGTSQAPGVGYSTVVNYAATNKVEKQLNKLRINNQNLSKLIANETNPEIKEKLFFSMAENFVEMGLDVDRLSVAALNLGAKDINRLIGTELIIQDLKMKAGVMPGSDQKTEAQVIESYKEKVGKEQADIFDDQLDALNTIVKKIKDKVDNPGNLGTAEKALGDIFTTYDSKLKESNQDGYNNKSRQDRLVQIIQTVRTDLAAENLANAKANPAIVKFVENQLTDSGTPLDNVKKEMLYINLGKQLALDQGRGIANEINVNTAAETILDDIKNVKVIQINSQEELEKVMNENKVAASKRPTFDKMPFGFVVGNTIYTQNKEAVDEDLKKGYLRAGTVILHEMAHIIDDGRMNAEGKKKYADNLFKAISNSENAALRRQHNEVIQQLNTIYGEVAWEKASEEYKDEYTKYIQESAFMYEDQIQLEKDENALVRTFNDLVTDANNLNTPDKALNYMLANNSAFRKGKISRKSKKALQQAKPADIKLSEKNLNTLADKFKDNPDSLTAEQMVDFYQQYTNTALAAMGYNVGKGDIAPDFALGIATNSFDRVVRTYKPEDGSFTNWIYSTVGREGKAKIGEEIERKKSLVRQSQAQEQTRLKSDETAESRIELEERAARESKTQQRKIDPRKLPLVSRKIKDIEKDVDIRPEKVPTATFKSISDDYGRKVASRIYDVSENKLGKDAKNLTYADNIRDGRLVKSELGQLQQDFKTVDGTRRAIKLLPEFNIVTPEATVDESGETIPTSRNLSGTSLGIANKVLDFFYENYTDPRALSENAETRKQAITNKSGRSKGSTSQTQVKRLKPEFRGTISNEAIKKAQNEFAEINRDFAEIKDARARLKAIRDVGQKLKGWTNLIGGIVANTVADQKVSKMPLRTAKPRKQIRADIRGGRSPIQFSQKVRAAFDLELGGRSKVDRLMSVYSIAPTLNLKQLVLTEEGRKQIVDTFRDEVFILLPRAAWQQRDSFTNSNANYGISISKGSKAEIDGFNQLKRDIKAEIDNAPDSAFGANIEGVADFKLSSYDTVFKGSEADIKDKADKFNDKTTKIHKALWERISKRIAGNKQRASAIATYLKLTANDKSSWHRKGAAIYGYSINPKQRYEYEHAMPATSAYLYLLNSILGKQNFSQSYDLVMQNYKVIALDKAEDNKLRKAGLQRGMPFGWDITNNFWWQRYFNTIVAKQDGGINPASIVDLDGNTLQDVFTINNDGSPYAGQTFIPQANAEITKGNIADDAMTKARNSVKYSEKTKKARVFDFDDTLAQTKSKVIVTMPAEEGMLDIAARRLFGETALKNKPGFLKTFDSLNKEQQAEVLRDVPGAVRKIDATEFAKEAANLEAEGAKFNFTEFDKIIEGKKGPLFDVAKKIQDAKNSGESIFILTARPPTAAVAIKKFLSELGLDIPLANITGLADGKPKAKADWFVDKYNEGFNDFYFADDALKNVNAVKKIFDVLDVKSRVQQARVKFSKKLSTDFNAMIERNKGVKTEATFSQIQARRRGKNQKRFAFFIPPSADDFRGLTMYTFAGKGKQGELDQEFFDKALIRPYQRGVAAMEVARTAARNDYRALLNENKDIRKKLKKKVEDTKFTHDEAIRVYLWNKEGFEIPGLSKADEKKLVDFVKKDKALVEFANGVKIITRKKQYLQPTEFWDGSTILGDLNNIVRSVNREQFLAEFIENADTIFSEQNLNKVEAIYGFRVRESLENIIFRMKTGQNKNKGSGRLVNEWNNWVNNSVGAIMFFNRRSALLQTISTVNFVNWSDNNPIKAGIAFANQPQYWRDFITLWNSPKLVSRRRGLRSDIQEAEIAAAAKKGGAQGVISYLLKVGFTPTQLADSFAIASGGATFYRNRINSYKKQGLNDSDAQKKAFEDFSSIADETQQSADPMLISQQQASVLGRLVLAFQNTPMQYTRLIKKAGQDLINNRGSKTENISKIIYYGFVQNLIFSTLQNALFALLPGFDDEEEDFKTDKERDKFFEKEQRREDSKIARTINSMVDTLLRGSGLAGAVVSTVKNVIMEYMEQNEKTEFQRENSDILIAALNISPPIGSKVRKINNFLQTEKFEKDVIAERGFDVTIDGRFQLSPSYDLVGELSSAIFNLPLDRAVDEVNAVTEALDSRNSNYQRLALLAGWRQWDVNARTEEHDLIKTTAKERRKKEGIEKAKETRKKNAEIKKKTKRYRVKILNAIPDSVRVEIQKREKKLKEDTPLFKLKQLNEEYNLNINYE